MRVPRTGLSIPATLVAFSPLAASQKPNIVFIMTENSTTHSKRRKHHSTTLNTTNRKDEALHTDSESPPIPSHAGCTISRGSLTCGMPMFKTEVS